MRNRINEFEQPIGRQVEDWTGATPPERAPIEGRLITLEPMDAALHASELFTAFSHDLTGEGWTYLPSEKPTSLDKFRVWVSEMQTSRDPLFFVIKDKARDQAIGFATYLRMQPAVGSIEVGWIAFSPLLQRTPQATEAMYLMMKQVFDVWGYRRYEWKCDALNGPSRAAAKRLGFTHEGVFRQATMYKGRNRDTAWFSVIDGEWPSLRRAFQSWLDPSNFDAEGRQKASLAAFQADVNL